MKKSMTIAALAGLAICSGMASAGTVLVHTSSGNAFKAQGGGEFRFERISGPIGQTGLASDVNENGNALFEGFGSANDFNRNIADFQTFCLELNEGIANNTVYNYSIDAGAIRGGNGGGNPDVVGSETAWLFSNFRRGTLAGYAYGGINDVGYDGQAGATRLAIENDRKRSAATLQHLTWWFEEELDDQGDIQDLSNLFNVWGNGNVLDAAQQAQALAWANAAIAAEQGGYSNPNVLVLNIFEDMDGDGVYTEGGTDVLHQSVLTLIPLPTGAGLAMAGLAMAAVRRRR